MTALIQALFVETVNESLEKVHIVGYRGIAHLLFMVNSAIKKRALHRTKILKGQLEALMKSIDNEDYCTSLLHQSHSIQSSLKSLDKLLLENHLNSHVKYQMQDPKQQEKAIQELIEVYTSSHR